MESPENASPNRLCATLGRLSKRIEKKLSAFHSENSSGAQDESPEAVDGAAALIAESRKARADKTWVITDGAVGMEAQGIAVAEAIGLPFTLKRVRPKGVMRLLPTPLQILLPAKASAARGEVERGARAPLAAARHLHRPPQRAHGPCRQAALGRLSRSISRIRKCRPGCSISWPRPSTTISRARTSSPPSAPCMA